MKHRDMVRNYGRYAQQPTQMLPVIHDPRRNNMEKVILAAVEFVRARARQTKKMAEQRPT